VRHLAHQRVDRFVGILANCFDADAVVFFDAQGEQLVETAGLRRP
jgi:hypothetical protein